jgi:hypothetical protein
MTKFASVPVANTPTGIIAARAIPSTMSEKASCACFAVSGANVNPFRLMVGLGILTAAFAPCANCWIPGTGFRICVRSPGTKSTSPPDGNSAGSGGAGTGPGNCGASPGFGRPGSVVVVGVKSTISTLGAGEERPVIRAKSAANDDCCG